MGPCNRYKEGVCTEKGEGISVVKERERRGEKDLGFITVCKLFLRVRMKGDTVEEQI